MSDERIFWYYKDPINQLRRCSKPYFNNFPRALGGKIRRFHLFMIFYSSSSPGTYRRIASIRMLPHSILTLITSFNSLGGDISSSSSCFPPLHQRTFICHREIQCSGLGSLDQRRPSHINSPFRVRYLTPCDFIN